MSRARRRLLVAVVGCLAGGTSAIRAVSAESTQARSGRVLHVGPARLLKLPSAAARVARDGDTVEIDAGAYPGDVAVWRQSHITVRAIGGMAHLDARGRAAEDKAVWVVAGDDVEIANVGLYGARSFGVNGAGLRHEGGRVTIRNCAFGRNEMGLLTWNVPSAELVVENSQFGDNAVDPRRAPGRIGHQIYVGSIARFTLRESYVHHGAGGHLVKSRARENIVVNNRIADEVGGHASYELEFPNGGLVVVAGNVIEQEPATENPIIIAYGAEGYRWGQNALRLIHNTIVDNLPALGVALKIWPGEHALFVRNNLLVGRSLVDPELGNAADGNVRASADDLVNASAGDYRLRPTSPLAGRVVRLAPWDLDGLASGDLPFLAGHVVPGAGETPNRPISER